MAVLKSIAFISNGHRFSNPVSSGPFAPFFRCCKLGEKGEGGVVRGRRGLTVEGDPSQIPLEASKITKMEIGKLQYIKTAGKLANDRR